MKDLGRNALGIRRWRDTKIDGVTLNAFWTRYNCTRTNKKFERHLDMGRGAMGYKGGERF